MHKQKLRHLIALITVLCLAFTGTGCGNSKQEVQADFDSFMKQLFVQEVQTDSLSLNYSLAHPEKYGIKDKKATLGNYGIRQMKADLSKYENYLSRLQKINYSTLTSDRKLTYEIVKNYLTQGLQSGDFPYYSECLGPTTGIQAQLPILLAEYSFYDKEDVEKYLGLLNCVKGYFEDIIEYEREKSKHGLFMNDNVANNIIKQCEAFILSPSDNFLIQYFNEKISDFKGLTAEEAAHYKALNAEAIACNVIPAYKELISALNELRGTGTNAAGLYYYPEGQAYYEYLAKLKTGSDKSMEEMIRMLETAMSNGIEAVSDLNNKDPSLVDKYLSFSSFPITDPKAILTDLKQDITADFPAAVPVNCEIKYVPESLTEYLSPAMYLVPPLDSYGNNSIYINGNSEKTLSMIYTTVAHESYPGHLYQCVYFRSKHPAPIRNILNFVGYDEGWATYVELYSYHLAGIDDDLADFLSINNMVILCMYARADIGIHYQGWKKKETVNYVNQYIGDKAVSGAIYDTLLEEPAIYLPYAIGFLEIKQLRMEAEKELGRRFIAKDFHKFLLDIGPAQFSVINEHMEKWVSSYK